MNFKYKYLVVSFNFVWFTIPYEFETFNFNFFSIIKALGVYFGNNKEEREKLNWENKIDKVNTLFFSWGKQYLYCF
jgi:hypothetical protein